MSYHNKETLLVAIDPYSSILWHIIVCYSMIIVYWSTTKIKSLSKSPVSGARPYWLRGRRLSGGGGEGSPLRVL